MKKTWTNELPGRRKPPKAGWYRGPDAEMPGRYVLESGVSTPLYFPGLSDPADKDRTEERWSGSAAFVADPERVEYQNYRTVWSCSYSKIPSNEGRCRCAARRAMEALQAYYDRTGQRWEIVRDAAAKEGRWMPKLPPKDAS